MHGNAKSPEDLETAGRLGVGRIVIDSLPEIDHLTGIVPRRAPQQVMVRVVPGIAAGGHTKIQTGTDDQKFGLSLADGSARRAMDAILRRPQLSLAGLHCHLGSQITSVEPYVTAVQRMVGLMAQVRDQHGLELPQLNIGGGHGIAYRPGEQSLDIGILAGRVRAALEDGCAETNLLVPRLTLEPGRALLGPAGVAVYRVLSVKQTSGRTAFYPGPVKLEHLPMSADERPEPRYGPDRGMRSVPGKKRQPQTR